MVTTRKSPVSARVKPAGKPAAEPARANRPSNAAAGKKAVQAAKPARSTLKSSANPTPIAAPAKSEKPPKKVKMKVIRDSFTMPEHDHAKLAQLKKKCLAEGVQVKKSELLRAGLAALEVMPLKRLLIEVQAVAKVKTGRPGKA